MKIALVTTTINIPHVLKLYRACSEDVAFFVTGDMKTDSIPFKRFYREIPNCFAYDVVDQNTSMNWACHELLGWNTISRRNIATLEALKWGAEIIVTIDDDNIPMSTDYFDRFEMVLGAPFSGLAVKGDGYWWDVGRYLIPKAPHRGFPHEISPVLGFDHVVDAKVGAAAGICLGNPDISAVDRISQAPIVHGVAEVLRAGVVVSPGVHTVFNSQNTAFLRELAPCFLMVPQFSRYDDILASLLCQRVMRERGLHVHYGQPFVHQERNPHNLLKDLQAEMWGAQHIVEFAGWLEHIHLAKGDSVLGHVQTIYGQMKELRWIPAGVPELGLAWVQDCERVL